MKITHTLSCAIIALFVGLKLFGWLFWRLFSDGQTVTISTGTIVVSFAALALVGFSVGAVWVRFARPANDNELKLVGGGVFGLTVFTKLCASGTCLPVAVLGSAFTVVQLLPALLGVKIAALVLGRGETELRFNGSEGRGLMRVMGKDHADTSS